MSDQTSSDSITFTYIDQEGGEVSVSCAEGATLMETARDHQVAGIDGDCGGCCACGTCLIRLEPELLEKLPEMGDEERELIAFSTDKPQGCRLGCQIQASALLQGARLTVATDG